LKFFHESLLFSAVDILNFLDCEHHTYLDLIDLETPLPKTQSNEEHMLIQAKGAAHEAKYAHKLKENQIRFTDIEQAGKTLTEKMQATLEAMRSGVDIIYQPHLKKGNLFGIADFMQRVSRPSEPGTYCYEIIDTKLALSPRTRFVIQLTFYSHILASIQGVDPRHMRVILGDGTEKVFLYQDCNRYFKNLVNRFLQRIESWKNKKSVQTYPDPCERCEMCQWLELCENKRLKDDHLCQVAGISKIQIKKLSGAGISTMKGLAEIDPEKTIRGMAFQTLERLRRQANLQQQAKETGQNYLELLPVPEGERRGFARLPRPCPGDMFFDMEGNPMEEGGLEYLFGVYLFEQGKEQFKTFWAHSREEEKKAFEQFMDFVMARLRKYPDAHIYHYAHYEQTALKKLMSLHGTREAEVDSLLRRGRLIDLYKVFREGIRVSEPRYSIKNLEHFYMQKREGDVQDAAASIVVYERWKETKDDSLLQKIRDYNYDDVLSTYLLREWLLTLRPDSLSWAGEPEQKGKEQAAADLNEHEQRIEDYRKIMVDPLPKDRSLWTKDEHILELVWQMLDFYRRADKPQWWSMFSRLEMDEQELIEDIESIGGVKLDPSVPAEAVKRSTRWACVFPEQETKIKTGDNVICIQNQMDLRDIEVNEAEGRVSFTSSSSVDLPETFGIGPGKPINNKVLKEAVFRFADSLIAGDDRYMAVRSVLRHDLPNIRGHSSGDPIIDETKPVLPQMSKKISNLDHSSIFVQGPPGSGKTYTGSHVIVDLLQKGCRVGVSSNSHKAINNLLQAVENVARGKGVVFQGAKKCTRGNEGSRFKGCMIEDVFTNDEAALSDNQLVAGTAWLFSRPEMDGQLDFLFIDEAGQVALANLVAMGTSAHNLVLLGDQMQLGQPIQGIHPGRSGASSLEYLLNGMATIPQEQGIFLGTTWRMHPEVCTLISDMIYEGRLEAEPRNINQQIILNEEAHPDLVPAGVRFVPAVHDGCSQKSHQEAEIIKGLIESLSRQKYQDREHTIHSFGLENILVVAPYNMQVNLLKSVLPEKARVGTVDKFQGQQAEVVIVSMTTSSQEYLPRHIDFLFSKNRLNVALSRARCLAVVVANPELMSIKCSQPDQVALVNALCWVREYSDLF
jgi:uncharacterized protein